MHFIRTMTYPLAALRSVPLPDKPRLFDRARSFARAMASAMVWPITSSGAARNKSASLSPT
jgi:hypothetical protein